MRPWYTVYVEQRVIALKEKILIVDDDAEIRELLRILLENENFEVLEAENGAKAVKLLSDDLAIIILDVTMPGISGYSVCSQIRKQSNVPVLFLTAKTQESDMTMGFSSGGDDYLTKPFSYNELLMRVKSMLRRYHVYGGQTCSPARSEQIVYRDLAVRRAFNEVYKRGVEVPLTETEYQLLKLMMSYQGKIFSAENLYESVWNEPFLTVNANTVMVHIRKIRAKIEDDPQNPEIIKTVWGKGYRIDQTP